jgi:hypothetical protein
MMFSGQLESGLYERESAYPRVVVEEASRLPSSRCSRRIRTFEASNIIMRL